MGITIDHRGIDVSVCGQGVSVGPTGVNVSALGQVVSAGPTGVYVGNNRFPTNSSVVVSSSGIFVNGKSVTQTSSTSSSVLNINPQTMSNINQSCAFSAGFIAYMADDENAGSPFSVLMASLSGAGTSFLTELISQMAPKYIAPLIPAALLATSAYYMYNRKISKLRRNRK
jgi:hypothetical protein